MSKLTIFGFIVLVLVMAEVISLLQLRHSLTTNTAYWQHRIDQPGELTYVALGDSAAQGIGATRPEKGYVGLLASRLEAKSGKSVRVVNLSVSGAKIQDVIDKQLPQLSSYDPDYVTIEIGGNDIVNFNQQKYRQSFEKLIPLLPPGTIVANMPNFGGRIKRVVAVKQANQIIADIAAKNDLRVADLYTYTKTRESPFNYAADFFHPSNRGYRNWSDAFWDRLKDL